MTTFNKLKDDQLIPHNLTLKRSNLLIMGPDGSKLSTNGILRYPLTFMGKNGLKFTLSKFYVIQNLCNDLNFGKIILDKLKTTWNFNTQIITILGKYIKLQPQKPNTGIDKIQL